MYEVVSAARWAFVRAYNSAGGPDALSTHAIEYTLPARTVSLDLTSIPGASSLFAVKQLWLKLTTEAKFTLLISADSSDYSFRVGDDKLASDTTVALGHPIYYDILNTTFARFSPALPAGSVLRVDFWGLAPDPNLTSNDPLDNGADLAEILHQPVLDKATAQVFRLLDDDRADKFELEAERKIVDALHALAIRSGAPLRTKPFRFRRGRRI